MSSLDVLVRLRAELGDYINSMEQAANATEKVGDAAKKASGDIEASGKKADDSAKAVAKVGDSAKEAGKKTEEASHAFNKGFIQSKKHADDLGRSIKKITLSDGAAGMAERLSVGFERAQKNLNHAVKTGATHAREYSKEWTKVGAGLTVAGGAVLATGAAALTAGINYNTLQQKSQSALKVLTGGAKEANVQMAKMDAFAKTSPFSKATFLQAQQQMLGFGIEAKKVIPYLDAIQDSVAATGGNNHQLSELSLIFSQIQSAQKITAQDLMQFGQRGVDAATLIGSQMGKTGQQIREEITAGTLDAEAALDALAAGMTEKFGGAAAGMKDTFEGATDRLKAAWRDFGAELAKPLVNPDGGGFLVDLTNGAADALRNFEKLPPGIKAVTTGVVGLGAAVAVGAGGFMMLAPRALEAWDALKKFGVTADKAKGWAGKIGTVGAAAAGVTMLATALGRLSSDHNQAQIDKSMGRVSNAIADMITDTGKGSAALDVLFQKRDGSALVGEVTSLQGAFEWMAKDDWQTRFDRWGQGIVNAFNPDIKGDVATMGDAFARVDEGLTELVNSGKADEAAKVFEQIKKSAKDQGVSLEDVNEKFSGYLDALAQLEAEGKYDATPVTKSLAEIQDQAAQTASEVMKLGQELDALGSVNRASDKAISEFHKTLDAVKKRAAETSGGISHLTETGRANREALRELAEGAMNAATGMTTLGESEATVAKHLSGSYKSFMELATSMGASKAEAEELARQLMGIPEGVKVETWMDNKAKELAEATKASIDDIPELKNVEVITTDNGSVQVTQEQIDSIRDRTVGIAVSDDGTIMEVQGGINNIKGKTEYLLVDDKGTVQTVQKKIINVKGKKETIFVTDDGTVVKVQGKINGVKGKSATVTVGASGVGATQGAINGIKGKTVFVDIVQRMTIQKATSKTHPNVVRPGLATGGRIGGYATGGRLPVLGLGGVDQILAINSMGKAIARVDEGEWVIRARQAERFNRVLNLINMNHPSIQHLAGYATGGRVNARASSTQYAGANVHVQVPTSAPQTNVTLNTTVNNPVGEPTYREVQRSLSLLAHPEIGGVTLD